MNLSSHCFGCLQATAAGCRVVKDTDASMSVWLIVKNKNRAAALNILIVI